MLKFLGDTVGGRNPASQLRLVNISIIHKGLTKIPGGCLGFLNHQQYEKDGFCCKFGRCVFFLVSQAEVFHIDTT